MDIGHFYFLADDYFLDFPDPYLMSNKETTNGQVHDRPCFYTFKDAKTGLYWMIPFSSKVTKFKNEYQKKIIKYGRCDTIAFGLVLKSICLSRCFLLYIKRNNLIYYIEIWKKKRYNIIGFRGRKLFLLL